MPGSEARPGEAPVDWWSVPHVATGIALALLVDPWWMALVLLVGYEVLEAGLRHIPGKDGGLFEYESWPNIFADVAFGMLGWFLGSLSPWRWVVIL